MESEDLRDEEEPQEEHSVGCPWRKARSNSKNRTSAIHLSGSGMVHPRPWGARNPQDIPCYCKPSNAKHAPRISRSPTRLSDLRSRHEKEYSKAKITDIVSSMCAQMDRKRIKMTEYEMNLFLDTMKEKLQKYKEAPLKSEKSSKGEKQHQAQGKEKSPVRRPRTAQSLVAAPPLNAMQAGVLRENPADQQPLPRGAAQPVLGKLETKKYVLELRSDDQVPAGLKQMLGMMGPQEQQYVLMPDGQVAPAYVPASEYHVLNAGVQLRHHEENTMLLVGNQRVAAAPPRLKQPPLTNLSPARLRR